MRDLPYSLKSAACLAALAVSALISLASCGGSDSNTAVSANSAISAPSVSSSGGVVEITIDGLGTNHPQTAVKWVTPTSGTAGENLASKSLAATSPLPLFLDFAGLSTSTVDSGGFRYIAATLKVRNAQACGAPPAGGTCAPYTTARNNVTLFAVSSASTIDGTALTRFNKFDGTAANAALALQLLPMHGANSVLGTVEPIGASFQAYNEGEQPPPEVGVTSVFPYGFVVRNVNDGSRVLPASPANGQYDGIVTLGFRIPIQTVATDNPFKISLLFQTADDANRRVTQSLQEQDPAGDVAATLRATELSSIDLAVLGGRVAQTTIGNPICRVRTAGTVGTPTAFLVNQIPNTPAVRAAPFNLQNLSRTGELSLGFCENMNPPTQASLVVHGAMSGQRVTGGNYSAAYTGGGASTRRNQLIMSPTSRSYLRNELVMFSATAANINTSSEAITPFVGSFRVVGSQPGSLGTFDPQVLTSMGNEPQDLAVGDLDGDGRPDVVTANESSNNISVRLTGVGAVLGAVTNFAMGTGTNGVVLGDLDGDGILDVATANRGSNNVTYRLGNGTGGFGAINTLAAQTDTNHLALGDLNGDGRLDIVAVNRISESISIFLNSGAGAFSAATNLSMGTAPLFVVLGDLNNDGRLDVVTSNSLTSSLIVRMGTGSGSFAAPLSVAAGVTPQRIALGDLNGDGRLDIVIPNVNSVEVRILLGNGLGSFTSGETYVLPANSSPGHVTVGDINGDSKLDFVVSLNNSGVNGNAARIFFGNGDATFVTGSTVTLNVFPGTSALADLNGDSRLDLVVANAGSDNVSVLLGN